jgi:hypothetical protein
MFLMIGCKEKKKNSEVVKGKEVVELECVFIVYVKKRMLSLDET